LEENAGESSGYMHKGIASSGTGRKFGEELDDEESEASRQNVKDTVKNERKGDGNILENGNQTTAVKFKKRRVRR
jgi:hypothetical protein